MRFSGIGYNEPKRYKLPGHRWTGKESPDFLIPHERLCRLCCKILEWLREHISIVLFTIINQVLKENLENHSHIWRYLMFIWHNASLRTVSLTNNGDYSSKGQYLYHTQSFCSLLQSYYRVLICLTEDIYQVRILTILSSWQSLAISAQHFLQLLFNLYKAEL